MIFRKRKKAEPPAELSVARAQIKGILADVIERIDSIVADLESKDENERKGSGADQEARGTTA